MGQFIRTGILTYFSIGKSSMLSISKQKADAIDIVAKAVVGNPESFEMKDNKDTYAWYLRPELMQEPLLSFLKRYYADFYGEGSAYYNKHCKQAIEYLSQKPSKEELQDWMDDRNTNALFDPGDDYRDIIIAGKRMSIYFSSIALSVEGKVMYEEFERHLLFFERSIRKVYSGDPLGGCLIIDIS